MKDLLQFRLTLHSKIAKMEEEHDKLNSEIYIKLRRTFKPYLVRKIGYQLYYFDKKKIKTTENTQMAGGFILLDHILGILDEIPEKKNKKYPELEKLESKMKIFHVSVLSPTSTSPKYIKLACESKQAKFWKNFFLFCCNKYATVDALRFNPHLITGYTRYLLTRTPVFDWVKTIRNTKFFIFILFHILFLFSIFYFLFFISLYILFLFIFYFYFHSIFYFYLFHLFNYLILYYILILFIIIFYFLFFLIFIFVYYSFIFFVFFIIFFFLLASLEKLDLWFVTLSNERKMLPENFDMSLFVMAISVIVGTQHHKLILIMLKLVYNTIQIFREKQRDKLLSFFFEEKMFFDFFLSWNLDVRIYFQFLLCFKVFKIREAVLLSLIEQKKKRPSENNVPSIVSLYLAVDTKYYLVLQERLKTLFENTSISRSYPSNYRDQALMHWNKLRKIYKEEYEGQTVSPLVRKYPVLRPPMLIQFNPMHQY